MNDTGTSSSISAETAPLLPCPFCGSTDIDPAFVQYANDSECSPGCFDCGATAETAEKWNKRSILPADEPSPLVEFGDGWAKVHFRREVTDEDRARIKAAVFRQSLDAYEYAKTLLVSFVEEHCSPVPEWKPNDNIIGVLVQFDNALCITRQIKEERDEARAALASARG